MLSFGRVLLAPTMDGGKAAASVNVIASLEARGERWDLVMPCWTLCGTPVCFPARLPRGSNRLVPLLVLYQNQVDGIFDNVIFAVGNVARS